MCIPSSLQSCTISLLNSVLLLQRLYKVSYKTLNNIVVGFRGPLQNHMMWANVLPLRRAFLYIKLATDLRSRASIHLSIQQERIRIKKMNKKTTRPKLGGCGQDWEHEATTRTLRMNYLIIRTGFELHLSACLVLLAFLLLFAPATPTRWPCLPYRLDDRAPRRHIHSISPHYYYS